MKIFFKKLMLFLIILVISVGLVSVLINIHVISSTKNCIISPETASVLNADAILVLGAAVRPDKTPSPMLQDRLNQGIDLYNLKASNRVLVSGDNSTIHYDEVTVMKNYILASGIPSEDVFKDHAGFNTYNSMFRAKEIFRVNRVIIVTQEYHLYRAIYIAKHLGMDAYGVASNPRIYSGQSARDFREFLARVKDFFLSIVKPDSVFLGDEIPISGNGNLY